MAFFSTPGTEALYSGEAMISACASSILRQRSRAPFGSPSSASTSPSYGGIGKSPSVADSASAPAPTTRAETTAASRALTDPLREEPDSTSARREVRACTPSCGRAGSAGKWSLSVGFMPSPALCSLRCAFCAVPSALSGT